VLVLLGAGIGCGDDARTVPADASPKVPTVVLDHADPTDFYARPFPRDDRRNPDGTIDLSTYPRPSALIREYVDAFAADGHGFGEASGIFFRFSAPIDAGTLPQTPEAALAADASVYLIELPGGRRQPIKVGVRARGGPFAGPNLLAILPFPGLPLRPQTQYAAVITRRVLDATGAKVGRDSGFGDALGGPVLAPLRAWAQSAGAGTLDDIAGATVFTTGEPTRDMQALREAVRADIEAPEPQALSWQSGDGFDEYDGTYTGPIYQQGTPPYLTIDQGGSIAWWNGQPKIVRIESIRFALTLPKGEKPPAGGWPVVLYAHGTGGSYRSFINEGVAARLAAVGVAAISIDQVLHGPRDPTGSDPDITFFNFQNIAAARDNVRQGALDDFQLLRLLTSWSAGLALPMTHAHAWFDPARVAFMGHSQGGLTGPLFVAYEPGVRGAVFSGAAGNLILALLNKTRPVDIPGLVAGLLADDPIDQLHPFLSMVQTYFEPADPANYGRLYFQEPPAGMAPRSIFQTIGLVDHYAPVPGLKAFMLAMGLQPVGMLPDPIEGLDLQGLQPAPGGLPVQANVAGGAATGVAAEYVARGYDGHFVVFLEPNAQRQSTGFLASLVAVGSAPATLPP